MKKKVEKSKSIYLLYVLLLLLLFFQQFFQHPHIKINILFRDRQKDRTAVEDWFRRWPLPSKNNSLEIKIPGPAVFARSQRTLSSSIFVKLKCKELC